MARHHSEPLDDQLRDGLIQRFEFTYDVCPRTLRRFIRQAAASPEEVDRMAVQDLIRTANQQGLLLDDWPAWHRYRDARAKTSNAYHAKTAQEVAESLPGFLAEAEYLRDELRVRLSVIREIALAPAERAIVQAILRAHLPSVTQAFVFGSRATATARRYSDLDLALEYEKPLSLDVLAAIAEALSESELAYKVDILDLRSVDAAFRTIIEADMIALPF